MTHERVPRWALYVMIGISAFLLVAVVAYPIVKARMTAALPPPTTVDARTGLVLTNLDPVVGGMEVPVPQGYRITVEAVLAETDFALLEVFDSASQDRHQFHSIGDPGAIADPTSTCEGQMLTLYQEIGWSGEEVTVEPLEAGGGIQAASCTHSQVVDVLGGEYTYTYRIYGREDGTGIIHQSRVATASLTSDPEGHEASDTYFTCLISDHLGAELPQCS